MDENQFLMTVLISKGTKILPIEEANIIRTTLLSSNNQAISNYLMGSN